MSQAPTALHAGLMPVEIFPTPNALSRAAADAFLARLTAEPDAVVCLATGSSPTRTYRLLAAEARLRPALFARLRVVKLDEWLGLPMTHPSTCEAYLRQHFLAPLAVSPERYLAFRSDAPDPLAECARVTAALDAWGGIDLALLGLGVNGHLGLNEPGVSPALRAHVAPLAPATAQHAMLRDHHAHVTSGITLGLKDLLAARQGILLVTGRQKAHVLQSLVKGAPPETFPAAHLRTLSTYRCLCDRDAAGTQLPNRPA